MKELNAAIVWYGQLASKQDDDVKEFSFSFFFDSFIQQKREKFLAQKNFNFFAEQKAYAYFNSTKMLIKVGFVFDFG